MAETWVCCYCGKDSGSGVLPQGWNLTRGGKGYCYECWEKAINIPENRFGIVVWDRLKDGCFKEVDAMTATERVTFSIPQTEEEARQSREETLESYNLYLTNNFKEWERQLELYITNRGKKEEG